MADLRKMTLEGLRELARKVLGPGHSRHKTKGDLLAALEAAEEKQPAKPGAKASSKAAPRAPAATGRAAARSTRTTKKGEAPAPRKGEGAEAGKGSRAAAAVKAVRAAGKAAKAGVRAAARAGKAAAAGAAEGVRSAASPRPRKPGKLAAAAAAVAEAAANVSAAARGGRARRGSTEQGQTADPAGFFVARVRGEDAVREAPHPMTETVEEAEEAANAAPDARPPEPPQAPAGGYDEQLGDLPWGYGDDAFVALPRDPRTLFLYWDLAQDSVRAAFDGLEHPRAQLRILARAGDGWEPVRTLEFALEARGYYVHDLEPGRVYRAEIHAVGRGGGDRVVGRGSNEMMLPPLGPSPVIDDRFIRIPWDLPLGRLLGPGHAGGPFSEEARALLARLSDWSRFALRGAGGGGSAGGIGGRSAASWPTSPAPTSPGMGFGGGGREGA